MTPKVSDHLPWPIRIGPDIYIDTKDGRIRLEPLIASEYAKAWLEVLNGAYVWHSMPHGPLEHGG